MSAMGPTATGNAQDLEVSAARGVDADGATMVRSEERLLVGVQRRVTERVVLRKRVVTEQVQQTVTLRREELEIERVPVTGDADGVDGTDQSAEPEDVGDEIEIILYAERPVLATEVVAVERVRIFREQVTEDATVTEQLRKERVDVEESSPVR